MQHFVVWQQAAARAARTREPEEILKALCCRGGQPVLARSARDSVIRKPDWCVQQPLVSHVYAYVVVDMPAHTLAALTCPCSQQC